MSSWRAKVSFTWTGDRAHDDAVVAGGLVMLVGYGVDCLPRGSQTLVHIRNHAAILFSLSLSLLGICCVVLYANVSAFLAVLDTLLTAGMCCSERSTQHVYSRQRCRGGCRASLPQCVYYLLPMSHRMSRLRALPFPPSRNRCNPSSRSPKARAA